MLSLLVFCCRLCDPAWSAGEVCGGITGIICTGANEFCEFPTGTCQVADNQGICTAIPDLCPEVWSPVCGCDGVTYSNDCYRQMAQVSKDYDGACQVQNVCLDNSDCLSSQFCAKADADCGGSGICQDKPLVCPDVWAPVCGCDGVTYSNSCVAMAAGVNVIHSGQCNLPECAVRPPVDYSGDCRVTIVDFAIFVSYWLDCGLVPVSACWP